MPKKILIVEDEANIRELLRLYLEREGYTVLEAENGVEGIKKWKSDKPDMLLLDVMMPVMDGWEVCREIRAESDVPIIMLTAKGSEYDRVLGLDLGADYYLAKPFGVMEFVSCVKAVLRRCQPRQVEHLLKTGGLIVNIDEHTVTIDGERITLTYKEFELLRLFLSHPGMAFTRDQLFNEVWGMDYCGDTRTVDMHIRTLRQKLGKYGARIETVRGVGYRLEVQP